MVPFCSWGDCLTETVTHREYPWVLLSAPSDLCCSCSWCNQVSWPSSLTLCVDLHPLTRIEMGSGYIAYIYKELKLLEFLLVPVKKIFGLFP